MIGRILVSGCFVLGAGAASAATVGFDFGISGNTNVPVFTLTNTSSAADLTGFSYTIGDTTRNFDYIAWLDISALSAGTIVEGSPDNGGTRFDRIALGLTGFAPGETISFESDVDQDDFNVTLDYRNVMFNNGAAPNALLSATFSTGQIVDFTLPDAPSQTSYSISASLTPIPLPAGLPLLLGALGGLALLRRRT